MQYQPAPDLEKQMAQIVEKLGLNHINVDRVTCIRSRGSKARGIIARLHGLDKVMQLATKTGAYYVIEFLELFEKFPEKEKIETMIHELLHIPKNFGGGFRHHDYVKNRRVKELYKRYIDNNSA